MKKLAFIFLCVSVCFGQAKLAHMLSGVKYVTSGTYTFATADGTQVVSFDGTTAATLPRGTVAGFGSGHVFAAYNKGGSPVVITCDNCTINGAGSFTLATDASVEFRSDGLNYVAMAGGGGGPGNGGGILGVTASPPMQSSGGTLPNVSLPAASANDSGYLGASDFVSFSNRLSSLTATPPLSATAGLNPTISLQAATTTNPGYLTAGDWNTFNNKVGAVTAGAPLLSSGGSSPNLTIQQADSTHSGFLSFTDWNTFNSAVGAAGDLKSVPTASQSVRQPPTTSFDPNVLQKTRYVDSSWTWTQSPSGSLTGGVQATVTLTPCPRGIDASGDYHLGVTSSYNGTAFSGPGGYKVHIGAVGTSEDVFVTGGTCTPSAASGTIVFTPYFSHGAGFSVSSASQGIQEAINDGCSVGGVVHPTPYYDNANCNIKLVPSTNYNVTGTVYYHALHSKFDGAGATLQCTTRGPCIEIGRQMDSTGYGDVEISNLWFQVPSNLAASDQSFAGCSVASTQRTAGVVTITTTGTCPLRTGDPVTILWTDDVAYWGDVPYITVTTANTFTYPVHGAGASVPANIALQSTPGTVALTFAAIRDNVMGGRFNKVGLSNISSIGKFNLFFDFWDDEAATIEGFDNRSAALNGNANWTGSFVFSGGAQNLPYAATQTASVITLTNSTITANGSSCATILNSNGFYVNNTVCQSASPWQFNISNTEGNYQGAFFSDIYSESSVSMNPLGAGAVTPWGGTGIVGLIAGPSTSAASFGVTGAGGFGGALASYGSGGTSYTYYLVTKDANDSSSTAPIPIMVYRSTGSDSPIIYWPRQAHGAHTITYDILRAATTSGGVYTTVPYYGGCAGGTTAACGSVATALPQCSGFVCTFTDTAASATTAYTLKLDGAATFVGNFAFYPAAGAGITASTPLYSMREQPMTSPSAVGPTNIAMDCDRRGVVTPGGWTQCLGSGNAATNSVPSQNALLLNDGPALGTGFPTLTKGRLNFTSPNGGSLGPHHMITVVDSQSALTKATITMRPPASANDAYIGTDGSSYTNTQLSFGAGTAISNYIASTGTGTGWLERLTASKKEFNVATQFDSTVSIVGEADGCAYFDGTQIKSMAAPCIGYPGSTGTQIPVVVDGAAWGTSLSVSGAGTSLFSLTGNAPALGAAACGDGSGGLTGDSCSVGTGSLNPGDTPTVGHVGVWASGTTLNGASTPIAADLITFASPTAGFARTSVGSQALTAGEFTGDCTNTGFAITCTKTGGVAFGTGATATIANYAPLASPTFTGHPTVEGVTSTGATGTGKFVFDTSPTIASPTISGHPTVEGVTATGALGTGKFIFSPDPAAGQAMVANSSNVFVATSISQDATLGPTGLWTNTGLRAKALPSLPGTFQYLDYTGSAWGFTDLTGTGTSCVQVSAGGQMSRSGAACGSGGGGAGTVSNSADANRFAVYAAPGTTVSPTSSAATIDSSGNATFNSVNVTSGGSAVTVCGTSTACFGMASGPMGSAGSMPLEGAILLDSATGLWNVAVPSNAPIPSLMNYRTSAVPALTMAGKLTTLASASGNAGLNLPHGAAPSSPTNGDVWTTTSGMYARINGSTQGPFASGGGAMTWPSTPGIAVCTGTPCTAWTTSLTAPSGTVVGTSDSQALTSKTYNGLNIISPGSKTLTISNTLTLSGTDGASLNLDNAVTASANATAVNYIPLSAGASKALSWTQYLPAAQLGAHSTGDVQNNNGGDLNISTFKGAAIPTSAPLLGSNSSQQLVSAVTPTLGTQNTTLGSLTIAGSAAASGKLSLNIAGATANPSIIQPGSNAGTVTLTLPTTSGTLATGNNVRICELHIWGTGTAGALQDTDDEPSSCFNGYGVTWTITAVYCLADNSSTTTTVTPIVKGGSATSILSGALTCGNNTFASGSLQGTPTLTSTGSVDANVTAAGTAKSIRLVIVGTI